MARHRGFVAAVILVASVGLATHRMTRSWEGWEHIASIVTKGDNLPILALIPLLSFFTYLALGQAFRHDRLIREGRRDEILDEMFK